MAVVCPICYSTPSIRGAVDADIVRKISLRKIAERHKLSVGSVQRHLKHLPQLLESEISVTSPSVYIGSVSYNVSVFVLPPEEEALGDYLEEEGEGVRT